MRHYSRKYPLTAAEREMATPEGLDLEDRQHYRVSGCSDGHHIKV